MEECITIGKYESLQDRIKRLTKNQSTTFEIKKDTNETLKFTQISNNYENRKQNNGKQNYLKKRQNTVADLNQFKITSPRNNQPFYNRQNQQNQFSQYIQKQRTQSKIPTSKIQHIVKKPQRNNQSISQNFNNVSNISSLMKRNDNNQFSSILSPSKYMTRVHTVQNDTDDVYEKHISKISHQPQSFTKRKVLGHSYNKSVADLTYREPYTMSHNYVNKVNENLRIKENMVSPTQKYMIKSRQNEYTANKTLTKCKSGMLERVPGKIFKNK